MVSSISGTLNLFILLLLVTPGYLALRRYLNVINLRNNYNRIEMVVYSLFISICSITIIYFGYSLWLLNFPDWISIGFSIKQLFTFNSWPNIGGIIYLDEYATIEDLQKIPISGYVFIYIIHIIICICIGSIYGGYKKSGLSNEVRNPLPNDAAWEIDSRDEMRIITQTGTEIRGRNPAHVDFEHGNGVLLFSPHEIIRDPTGIKQNEIERGQHLYVPEAEVSQILFYEPKDFDPDQEKGRKRDGTATRSYLNYVDDVLPWL